MVTERDITSVLLPVAKYYVLNRQQIQRLGFCDDPAGRITRRRIQAVVAPGYIHRHTLFTFSPLLGAPAPIYYPSRRGLEFLSEHFGDERFLNCNCQPPNPAHLLHWLAISDTRITIEEALARQSDVQLAGWINEHDIVNKDESRPERRYRLYTLLSESPRLVCAPDAAFLLSMRGVKKVFYLEQDRATVGAHQIAASRPKGYSVVAAQQLHRRHFPDTTLDTFSIITVVPTDNRRKALQKAMRNVPGAPIWKIVSQTDLTPEKLLHAPIFHPIDGEPTPLIKPSANSDDSQN